MPATVPAIHASPCKTPNAVEATRNENQVNRPIGTLSVSAVMQRRLTKRCLLVVLTDIGDMETSRTQATALARLARRHLVLLAAVRTPLLGRVIRTPANDLPAGARQAVALNLLRDRGRTLVALARDGIHALDVEPGQLTLPLINRFIELRGRNLL